MGRIFVDAFDVAAVSEPAPVIASRAHQLRNRDSDKINDGSIYGFNYDYDYDSTTTAPRALLPYGGNVYNPNTFSNEHYGELNSRGYRYGFALRSGDLQIDGKGNNFNVGVLGSGVSTRDRRRSITRSSISSIYNNVGLGGDFGTRTSFSSSSPFSNIHSFTSSVSSVIVDERDDDDAFLEEDEKTEELGVTVNHSHFNRNYRDDSVGNGNGNGNENGNNSYGFHLAEQEIRAFAADLANAETTEGVDEEDDEEGNTTANNSEGDGDNEDEEMEEAISDDTDDEEEETHDYARISEEEEDDEDDDDDGDDQGITAVGRDYASLQGGKNNSKACIYRCASCYSDICHSSLIISKDFWGNKGEAYFVKSVLNIKEDDHEVQKNMRTGRYGIKSIMCIQCDCCIGWKYVSSAEPTERYKVNKYVIEKNLLKTYKVPNRSI